MAGFFGFFDYEKEGPGIDPNAPKKKTFFVFWETFFRNFWKFASLNALYTVLCLPILTNGLANAGLTHVARNTARDKHSFGMSDFLDTIKRNWKQSLAAGIINTVIAVLIVIAFWFYSGFGGFAFAVGVGLTGAITFIFLIMNFYIWTIIITFNLRLSQIYRNAFSFVFINMGKNLLCGFCLLLVYAVYAVALYLFNTYLTVYIELFLIVFTLPAFRLLLIQYCTFPAIKKYMIDPYYAAHPDADIEKRRSLGLEVEEAEEEPIFQETVKSEIQEISDN